MRQIMEWLGGMPGVGHDPAVQNAAAMVVSIALYGLFLMREKTPPPARSRRGWRNADSVLAFAGGVNAQGRVRGTSPSGTRGGRNDRRPGRW